MTASNQAPLIAIAPDSFKGSLDASGVAKAIADGLGRALPLARFKLIPMADGGEGTVDAWLATSQSRLVSAEVQDPLGRKIIAHYGRNDDSRTAIIEMASASGLVLLDASERAPLAASTYGTGQLISHALDHGVRHIIIGIGGSATNDGGTGMARALGARFLDRHGRELEPGGGDLANLSKIDLSALDKRLEQTRIEVACDVTNPLYGPDGASAVYGPQKGATPEMVDRLDAALRRLADVTTEQWPELAEIPGRKGSGAAGGLGYGLQAFCGATLRRGVELVAEAISLRENLQGCQLVVTGEGKLDGQTLNGKTPAGVAAVATDLGIPTIAICGCLGPGYERVHEIGIQAVFPVAHGNYDPAAPQMGAHERIRDCAEQVGRLISIVLLDKRN